MFQRFLLWKSPWIYLCKCTESNISIHSCKRYHFLNHHQSSKQDSWVLQEGWGQKCFEKKDLKSYPSKGVPVRGISISFQLSRTPSVQNDQNRGGSPVLKWVELSWLIAALFQITTHRKKKTFCFASSSCSSYFRQQVGRTLRLASCKHIARGGMYAFLVGIMLLRTTWMKCLWYFGSSSETIQSWIKTWKIDFKISCFGFKEGCWKQGIRMCVQCNTIIMINVYA